MQLVDILRRFNYQLCQVRQTGNTIASGYFLQKNVDGAELRPFPNGIFHTITTSEEKHILKATVRGADGHIRHYNIYLLEGCVKTMPEGHGTHRGWAARKAA
jgi:hypothetical protein